MIQRRVVLQPVGRVVLVPMQGPVDDDLLRELGTAILDHLQRVGARGIVLDMSGVEILDESDLERLRGVVQTASLMGAPVVLAGVRPGVAAGLTMLDADAAWVRSVRTVEQGMELFS